MAARKPGRDLRRRAGALLDRIGVIDALLELRSRLGSPWLTILTYHRVTDTPGTGFDPDVVDATPEELDAQLSMFGRWFRFVTLEDVLAARRGKPLPPNPLLLTFDDGYRDNHDVVAPLLERHGVRGVFFVTSGYLSARRIFWWDRIHRLIASSTLEAIELEYPRKVRLPLGPARDEATQTVYRIVKNTYGLDLERFLDELTASAGSGWSAETERRLADDVLMTWDHVRALRRAGHAVQSHTRWHRVLQTLGTAELEDELGGARLDVEREIGEPVRAIAYPVGEPISRLTDLRRAVADAGYELGFSNASGVNFLVTSWDPFDVKRLSVERELSGDRLRSALALPWLISRAPLVQVDRPTTTA